MTKPLRSTRPTGRAILHSPAATAPATWLHGLWLVLLACAMSGAQAQSWPTHAVQFVVPASAGTTGDQIARLLVPRVAQELKAPAYVENRVGAGGVIGNEYVAKAPPDGYTFLVTNTAFATLAALKPKLPYDTARGFRSVILLGVSPLVLVVANSVPATTVGEFIAYARTQPPGTVTYASPGIGSVHHLTMERFEQQTGLRMNHVPYKSTATAVNDVAAGHVQASFVVLQSASALVRAGKLRMLAVASAERATAQFPNVPTLSEAGVPGMRTDTWVGISAPAGTPDAVVARLNRTVNAQLSLPEVRDAMTRMGIAPVGGTPERFDGLLKDELVMWSDVVKAGNISAD